MDDFLRMQRWPPGGQGGHVKGQGEIRLGGEKENGNFHVDSGGFIVQRMIAAPELPTQTGFREGCGGPGPPQADGTPEQPDPRPAPQNTGRETRQTLPAFGARPNHFSSHQKPESSLHLKGKVLLREITVHRYKPRGEGLGRRCVPAKGLYK